MPNPDVPQIVSVYPYDSFDFGSGLPVVTRYGVLITDQPTLDALITAASLRNITITFKNPPGGNSPEFDLRTGPQTLNQYQQQQVLENIGVYDLAAPLAQAGQSPAQEPVSGGTVPSVGTQNAAARSDHVHPNALPSSARIGALTGRPASRGADLHLTGANVGYLTGIPNGDFNSLGNYGFGGGSGNPYYNQYAAAFDTTLATFLHDLTLDAGAVIQAAQLGRGMCIVCTGTMTINGRIYTSGESPAAGAAPAQSSGVWVDSMGWSGYGGAAGGTGAGAAAALPGPGIACPAGIGGAGGASGGNAGGSAPSAALTELSDGMEALVYLRNLLGTSIGPVQGHAMGGLGGGAGAGDGSHKGGSGGGGAGNLILIAQKIVLGPTAIIESIGGNGAPGNGGNAGGGGAGGYGVVALHSLGFSIDPAAIVRTVPGTPGAGSGTGAAGTAVQSFSRFYDPASGFGGHGFGNGVLMCDWS